jgi:hypothetical protein
MFFDQSDSVEHMKAYKERIFFGSEKLLIQAGVRRCETCRVRPGKLHVPGCAMEECPLCGRALIGCDCSILSPWDAEKVIQGLYDQIENLETALGSADGGGPGKGVAPSYLQHAVMKYIFNNVPDTARKEIEEAFHIRFPGLVPQLQDEYGRGYYTAEQLADALGIPLQEVHERIDAMLTSGQKVETSEGRHLRKVH